MTNPETVTSPEPYVILATFCEKVLQEKDGVPSLIRVIDRLLAAEPPEGQAATFEIFYVAAIKSKSSLGEVKIRLRLFDDSGRPMAAKADEFVVQMSGNGRGGTVVARIELTVATPGLHWMHIEANDRLLTRTPLSVEWIPQESPNPI